MPRVASYRLNHRGVAALQQKFKAGRWTNVEAFCQAVGMKRDTYYALINRKKWFETATIHTILKSIGIAEADQSELMEYKAAEPTANHNLPIILTPFIGREKEKREIKSRLSKTRMLTLTGSGGSGKTRLAVQVASELCEQYPDGVRFVSLASLTSPDLVPQALQSALGTRETPGQSPIEKAIAYLKPMTLLVVLDNCEHLIVSCAQLATVLLGNCPQIKILATSRETRNIAGETVYRVPTLSLPDNASLLASEAKDDVLESANSDAVALFVASARAVTPNFRLTSQNGPYIVELCRRLDGIPLAIELAASRIRGLSVRHIIERLNDRFTLLIGQDPTKPPHQQTMRATLDWSYDLLEAKEQLLLARLSLFMGGWTLEAAEYVCSGEGLKANEILNLLTALIDKSLVVVEQQGEALRYQMHETIRQYSGDKLLNMQEVRWMRQHYHDYFLALAEEAEQKLKGKDQVVWLNQLEAEYNNLRAALEYNLSEAGSTAGLRLCSALSQFWYVHGYVSEGRHWCMIALEKTDAQEPVLRAKVLNVAGNLARLQSDYESARKLLEESLVLSRQSEDKRGIASSLNGLGEVAHDRSDYESARKLFNESLAMSRQLGEKQDIALALRNLGIVDLLIRNRGLVDCGQGDYEAAGKLFEESLAIFRKLGDKKSIAGVLGDLGELFRNRSDYDTARTYFEESLAICREIGDKRLIAMLLLGLSHISNKHDRVLAGKLLEESVAICRELGDKKGITEVLGSQAHMFMSKGDYITARTLYEECLAINRELQNKEGIAWTLRNLGHVEFEEGRFSEAKTRFEQSLAIFQPNCRLGIALSITDLGYVAHGQGDYSTAKAQYEMSELIFRELEDKPCIARTHNNLGLVAYDQGDYASAKTQHEQGLILYRTLGDKKRIAESMEAFARLAATEGQSIRAARLWGASEELRAAIGVPVPPYQRPRMERPMIAAREAVGEDRFGAAWTQGRTLSMEQAIEYALTNTGDCALADACGD
jgi:predicted ATPase